MGPAAPVALLFRDTRHTAIATLYCCNGEMDLFAIDGGLVLEVAEERERGVESIALLQLTHRDAKHLRRELDRVLRNRPRRQPGPMVLLPANEYRRLIACERAITAVPDPVASPQWRRRSPRERCGPRNG